MRPEFRNEDFALAYLITFSTYGTWLHGDRRGSVNRFHKRFGTSRLPHNELRRKYNHQQLKQSPVKMRSRERVLVEEAIRETCKMRRWDLWTINVRTNHVHTVVSACCKPEKVLAAFKATRRENSGRVVVGFLVEVRGLRTAVRSTYGWNMTSSMRWFMSSMIREDPCPK
jgi:REP element-mobilizing transposase RayT